MDCQQQEEHNHLQGKQYGRREFLKGAAKAAALGGAAMISGVEPDCLVQTRSSHYGGRSISRKITAS